MPSDMSREQWREHRRRRFRRRGRRAYIRSVYFLPSLATLGNAVCGFGAMYVAGLDPQKIEVDPWTQFFALHQYAVAAYLIFLAMIFDALDGRLARFTRHTTDFGGQLDSLADVVSFGAAPAFIALQLCHDSLRSLPIAVTRLIWVSGALYMSCAALRLARFNVSNEHGEQHHFSFLGLPSPGAAAAVASTVLMQQELLREGLLHHSDLLQNLAIGCVWALPLIVFATGLLMVSALRYPHLVNQYLRGRRSIGRLIFVLIGLLLMIVAHQYTLAVGCLGYAFWGPIYGLYRRFRPKPPLPPATPST